MNYIIKDGELYHWKYIKREPKPGGGYRYYYEPKNMHGGKTNLIQDVLGYDEEFDKDAANKNRIESYDKMLRAATMLKKLDNGGYDLRSSEFYKGPGTLDTVQKKERERWQNEYDYYSKQYEYFNKLSKETAESFDKTPIGHLSRINSQAVERGKRWLDKFPFKD